MSVFKEEFNYKSIDGIKNFIEKADEHDIFIGKADEYNKFLRLQLNGLFAKDRLSEKASLQEGEELRQEVVAYRDQCLHMAKICLKAEIMIYFCDQELQRYVGANDLKGIETILKMERKYITELQSELERYQPAAENILRLIKETTGDKWNDFIDYRKGDIDLYKQQLKKSVEKIDDMLQNMTLHLSSLKEGKKPTGSITNLLGYIQRAVQEIPEMLLQKLPADALKAKPIRSIQDGDNFTGE